MLATISTTLAAPTGNPRKSRAKPKFNLMGLPSEILINIFDYLDVFDSATLALACKRLASIALSYSQLDFPTNDTRRYAHWLPAAERHFLKKRLGDKYFPKRLRYCWNCKHYVPRCKSYWERQLKRKVIWENRCFARKPDTFVEWWGLPKTKIMLTKWSKEQAYKCPRCKIGA